MSTCASPSLLLLLSFDVDAAGGQHAESGQHARAIPARTSLHPLALLMAEHGQNLLNAGSGRGVPVPRLGLQRPES